VAAAPAPSRAPPLVKKTAKCPCGRRVSHYAVAEGQEVPPLECDAGRQRRLAVWLAVLAPCNPASVLMSMLTCYVLHTAPVCPALPAVCRIEGRRSQLADAFGVGDPSRHVPAFERQRAATYSGLLLAAAQQQPRFVEGLERQLADFLADPAVKRWA
jgi:hypothetical protein